MAVFGALIYISAWASALLVLTNRAIKPVTVTVIADDQRREYGKENPEFTCSYFGFVNGEDESYLTALPTIQTTAKTGSYPGTYPIIATNASAKNYEFTYERGTLTVTKAKQSVAWTQEPDDLCVGDEVEMDIEFSNEETTPSFSGYDEKVVRIEQKDGKWTLSAIGVGETTVSVKMPSSDCYEESQTISKAVTVKDPTGTFVFLNPFNPCANPILAAAHKKRTLLHIRIRQKIMGRRCCRPIIFCAPSCSGQSARRSCPRAAGGRHKKSGGEAGRKARLPAAKKRAAAYSPTSHRSTIGASGLNFSVRNGKRCAPPLSPP